MGTKFNKRAFGAVILKSINSNFNADFTHHPRTLPDGVVYSTDKALKYAVKDFFRKFYPTDKLLYVKRYNQKITPLSLDEAYVHFFGEPTVDKKGGKAKDDKNKLEVLTNLLSCLDVRLFGATFASKHGNISIHGVVQVNHGVNKYPQNEIYTEDILSPFKDGTKEDASNTTIGNQTNLREGHYVFHFSVNPRNLEDFYSILKESGADVNELSTDDIDKLKRAFNSGVTFLDSSRKIGTENEATLWVELKEGSLKLLPSFTDLIDVGEDRVIDLTRAELVINDVIDEVEKIELYYNPHLVKIKGLDKGGLIKHYNIISMQEIV